VDAPRGFGTISNPNTRQRSSDVVLSVLARDVAPSRAFPSPDWLAAVSKDWVTKRHGRTGKSLNGEAIDQFGVVAFDPQGSIAMRRRFIGK